MSEENKRTFEKVFPFLISTYCLYSLVVLLNLALNPNPFIKAYLFHFRAIAPLTMFGLIYGAVGVSAAVLILQFLKPKLRFLNLLLIIQFLITFYSLIFTLRNHAHASEYVSDFHFQVGGIYAVGLLICFYRMLRGHIFDFRFPIRKWGLIYGVGFPLLSIAPSILMNFWASPEALGKSELVRNSNACFKLEGNSIYIPKGCIAMSHFLRQKQGAKHLTVTYLCDYQIDGDPSVTPNLVSINYTPGYIPLDRKTALQKMKPGEHSLIDEPDLFCTSSSRAEARSERVSSFRYPQAVPIEPPAGPVSTSVNRL